MVMAISIGAIEQAIIDYGGNVSRVAESFGVSRGAIINRVNRSDTLKRALDEARDRRNENVRDVLYDMAISGEIPAATIFYAKAQLGWSEKQQVEHSGETRIIIEYADPNTDAT